MRLTKNSQFPRRNLVDDRGTFKEKHRRSDPKSPKRKETANCPRRGSRPWVMGETKGVHQGASDFGDRKRKLDGGHGENLRVPSPPLLP